MIYCGILAGGVGKRMEKNIPKQFLEINKIPIIILTLKKCLEIEEFDKIYIAVHNKWTEYLKGKILEYGIESAKIKIIDGGIERINSIENIVNDIENNLGIEEEDKIVIHDAVRPFVSKKILRDSIEALEKYEAVVAGIPVVDTMLWTEDNEKVSNMPERSKLFHGQSPDSFKLAILHKCLNDLTKDERKIITGTAQICMVKNIPIHIIEGNSFNIKITTPNDLILAEFILKGENI